MVEITTSLGGNTMTEPIVQLKNLSKTIKNKKIIDNVNLDLYPGTITGFLGPNGAGKTTTIRMIVGLMKPTSGDIIINGHDLNRQYEEAISQVGVIVENPEMYKFLSGYKNLEHFARMHKNITKERIDEVIQQMGLENRIHEKVSTYSLGMRQRLGLAQALLHRPNFLILDEPTNGLDPAGIHEFRNYLRFIAEQEGVAILVSSHLLAEMELMCDRIAVIQAGKIIDIRELQQQETATHYVLEAVDADTALHDLQIEFTKVNDQYILAITKQEVPTLIANLVAKGIAIYSISMQHTTLEDEFLALTGGGAIV